MADAPFDFAVFDSLVFDTDWTEAPPKPGGWQAQAAADVLWTAQSAGVTTWKPKQP